MQRGRQFSALTAVFIALVGWASVIPVHADSDGTELAAISGSAGRLARQMDIPAPLSDSDAALYRQAFDHEESAQRSAADRDISRLSDPLLVGHLLAIRYLAPSYHASGEELAGWMARFGDMPQAADIYALAKARLGSRASALKPPTRASASARAATDDPTQWDDGPADTPARAASAAEPRLWQQMRDRIRWAMHHDREDQAAQMIAEGEGKGLFTPRDADILKTALARRFFAAGRVGEAKRWAVSAAQRSGDQLPEAHWLAGLACWRNGETAESAHHFEQVANASGLSNWNVAAGAFWAARANLAAHRPQLVNHWLRQAATYPLTLYGLLARRALGVDIGYSWQSHPFTEADAEVLRHIPEAQRALALLQLGRRDSAEDELRQILPSAGPALARSLLALADDGGLPSLAVQASRVVASYDGRRHDIDDYPLPSWKPTTGGSVDRALVLAIARQESSFDPHARNRSGAVGLMQLMPATARAMGSAVPLTDPQVNLDLGQRYVRRLLDSEGVKGNLLLLAAAYNVGPATVARWLQTIKPGDDALLFLESIPFRETRALVEHVLTNFWAYRNRFDQSSPSLDAIAAGSWPMYDAAPLKTRMTPHVDN